MLNGTRFVLFLVVGYLSMSRAFAYLGIPPVKLFIGEIAIASFLLTRPHAIFDRWLNAMVNASPFSGFSIALAVSLGYGVVELLHGWSRGYSAVIAVESFAFHYYPVCFFIGLWAGEFDPTLLARLIRKLAWVNGIYGILFIATLNRIHIPIPGTTDVYLFAQPAGAGIAVLGLLSFEPRLSRVWHLLVLNMAVMLGLLVRAEYLGFTIALFLWAALTRRFDRLMAGVAVVGSLFAVALVTDFRIPAPSTRGGEISAKAILGRIIAPASTQLAANYTTRGDARSEAGTAQWRTRWWRAIWDTVNENTEAAIFGEGYGYPLAKLVGYTERDIRTPHSVFFYALAYGGWVGVIIFFALQAGLVRVLWLAFQESGNPFGLTIWTFSFTGAFFGNLYETPFGAIPLYLLAGMAASGLIAKQQRHESVSMPRFLSDAVPDY